MVFAGLLLFLLSSVLSMVLTRYVRDLAVARGWVSAPNSGRHVHSHAVPRIGGVAIYTSLVLLLGAVALVARARHVAVPNGLQMLALFTAATLIFVLGLLDDVRGLAPHTKFGVQAVAGLVLYAAGYRIFDVALLPHTTFATWLALPMTVCWVVWITNAFNLLDGLDGLAAGSALLSTLVMFVLSLIARNDAVSAITLVLCGTLIGFLRFNFNPATIFLGDSGSLLVGFVLSAAGIMGSHKSSTLVAVAIPVVSFGLPVMDTSIAIARRFLSGHPLFGADGEHIHHKLLKHGLTHRQAVICLYAVSGAFGLTSLCLLYPNGNVAGLVLIMLAAGIVMGVHKLRYHEFMELGRIAHRTLEQKQIIINNVSIRRATDALRACSNFHELCNILHLAFAENDFDEFHLTYDDAEQRLSRREAAPLALDTRGHLSFSWQKHPVRLGASAAWRLTLDLVTSQGRRAGNFAVIRRYSGKPLLVDVNLLTNAFSAALSKALENAGGHAVIEVASPVVPNTLRKTAGELSAD